MAQETFPQLKNLNDKPAKQKRVPSSPAARAPAKPLPPLTREEFTRYSRHLLLPGVGLRGQQHLKNARVLVIGLGGLGAPAGIYLATSGVGQLGLVDDGNVETPDLQGQMLFDQKDLGRPKLEIAHRQMKALSRDVKIELFQTRLRAHNALELIKPYDLVVDGTGDISAHYLINDACMMANRPLVYGLVSRFRGQVAYFPPEGPCYRCLYPNLPTLFGAQSSEDEGQLSALSGMIGSLMATETLKYFLNAGKLLKGQVVIWDSFQAEIKLVAFQKRPDCPACGKSKRMTQLIEPEFEIPRSAPPGVPSVEPKALFQKMRNGRFFLLLDVRSKAEYDLCHIKGAHHIPLLQLPQRLGELSRLTEIVVYCKNGSKSRVALEILRKAGFRRLQHLTGGILAWIEQVEPGMPRY